MGLMDSPMPEPSDDITRLTGSERPVDALAPWPGVPRVLTLEQLRSVLGDDRALWREMLKLLVTSSVPLLQALDAAIAEGDAHAVRRGAHKLKGSAATLGADEIAQFCGSLERMAAHGLLDGAEGLRGEIARSIQRLAVTIHTL